MAAKNDDSAGAVRIVLCTCPERDSLHIAHNLVNRGVAACVNIVPKITSVYVWEGEVCEEKETLLVIKTSAAVIADLRDAIIDVHSYAVPEILVVETETSESHGDYLRWVTESLREATAEAGE